LPLIGNLHQLPLTGRKKTFQDWHKKYGPIFSLKLGLETVIVLGDHHTSKELLDKRGGIYSSRPRAIIAGECMTKGLNTSLLPYGSQWKIHNRVQTALLNPRMAQHYQLLHDQESKQLVHAMLSTNDFVPQFNRFAISTLFGLSYGRQLKSCDAYEIHEIQEITRSIIGKSDVFTSLVGLVPVMNRLPRFLAPWKRKGDQYYERISRHFSGNTAAALTTPSWSWTKHAQQLWGPEISPHEMIFIIAILYEAGADTMATALQYFVMASVLHPNAVRRAQEEIDTVVGIGRLPVLDDMAHLPYVQAFINEVLRWRPMAPEGIAHQVTQEDQYLGYKIPCGATIIPNHWSMDMDEEIFPKPTEFCPERWIEDPKLPLSTFGFGRRACVGKHVAKHSLFMAVSRLLWGYNIEHALEKDGTRKEIDSWNLIHEGVLSTPAPFSALFTVRDQERGRIIEQEWMDIEKYNVFKVIGAKVLQS
jgi:cytochrome P450